MSKPFHAVVDFIRAFLAFVLICFGAVFELIAYVLWAIASCIDGEFTSSQLNREFDDFDDDDYGF